MKPNTPPKLTTVTLSATPLTFAEASTDGTRTAPDWIPLIPAGAVITARDGRVFIPDHAAAIASFMSSGMDICLDWDHALDSYGVKPGDAKAAAWIDELEIRDDGSLWGHVAYWTKAGRDSVESLEYRYISPVLLINDKLQVVGLPRASLVNNPALIMPALLSETASMNEKITTLLASFGIDADLSDESVQAAQETFALGKVPAPAAVSLETYIARDQYEAVVVELAAVKAEVATLAAEKHTARVESVIKEALSSGRLMPSEREFFTSQARANLPEVEKYLSSRAPLISAGSKPVQTPTDSTSLTDAEKIVGAAGGLTPEQLSAHKAAKLARLSK